MIDKATAQRIKDTANIVDVVSDYVHLIRSGSNYKALCPFHNERTPSFHINKARNMCYCFSCHKGGSPVNFLMEKEGISYPEALRQLAARYGIKIEERELTDAEKQQQSEREAMFIANEWAMKYFEKTLHDTPDGQNIGLSYLFNTRGVTPEAVKAFHLGFAPEDGNVFLSDAKSKGLRMDVLKSVGLVGQTEQGRFYFNYAGRVIFPFLNQSGKVVGFGARDLKGKGAKYKNSPESEIYKKSETLYGLFQSKNDINKEGECFLVEGYLDVIGLWQSGLKNVVASSGTSLTEGQIALIKRYTDNVTLIYDGDAAGIKASQRGIDMLLENGINVNVLLLPDGDDPDSFARKHSTEEIKEYFRTYKTDFIRYKVQVLLGDNQNTSPQSKFNALRSVIDSIAHIPNRMERLVYAQDTARLFGFSENEIIKELDRRRTLKEYEANKQRAAAILHTKDSPSQMEAQTTQQSSQETLPSTNNILDFFKERQKEYPLTPIEWKVLQYCIRYGFSVFCFEDIEEGNDTRQRAINVIEFVEEELAADDTFFSVPEFAHIFDLARDLMAEFFKDYEEKSKDISQEKDKLRQQGYKDIADKYTSIKDIKRAEEKLEYNLDEWMNQQLDSFSKSYLASALSSHEEETVRRIATEALLEKHQLSNIYSREKPAEQEDDRLFSLLPTALSVWKNGLLDLKIKDLFERFRSVSGKGNFQEEQEIQRELAVLMQTRSSIAKNIGDRILMPVTKNKYR